MSACVFTHCNGYILTKTCFFFAWFLLRFNFLLPLCNNILFTNQSYELKVSVLETFSVHTIYNHFEVRINVAPRLKFSYVSYVSHFTLFHLSFSCDLLRIFAHVIFVLSIMLNPLGYDCKLCVCVLFTVFICCGHVFDANVLYIFVVVVIRVV